MQIKEMIAILEVYIHLQTKQEVRVRPQLPDEMPLLLKAYAIAIKWIQDNNIKLTLQL